MANNNDNNLRIEYGVVVKYDGNAEELKLPSYVTRIAPYAFYGCKSLKKLVAPYKLSSVGKGAFYGCENLEEVDIPGRLYKRVKGENCFDKGADIYFRFYACGSEDLGDEDYSDKFDSEADYLASGGDKVRFADESAKNGANGGANDVYGDDEIISVVEEIIQEPERDPDVPIAEDAESLDEKLKAIVPEPEKEDAEPHENIVNLDDYVIEGNTVIKYIGTDKRTTVPEFITTIGDNAFANSDVEAVYLPAGLKIISKAAFGWCENLKDILFPDGLEIIDEYAFADCSALEEIILPDSVEFIGASAFHACSSVIGLRLPEGLKQIGRRAFDFCVSLEKLYIPDTVEKLYEGAFSHCESLTSVLLPSGLREISAWAFAECFELREITFPEGLVSIGEVAFMNCRSLVAFDLPSTLQEIGRQAFVGCEQLHLVRIPLRFEKDVKAKKIFHRLVNLQITYM